MIFDILLSVKNATFNATGTPKIETPSLFWYSVKMIFALLFILAIVFVFAYVLKRIQKTTGVLGGNLIKIKEVVPIMNRWYIVLVEVENKAFLIGLTEGNVTLISEVKPGESLTNEGDFEKIIKKIVSNSGGKV